MGHARGGGGRRRVGSQALVRTEAGTVTVNLGPRWYRAQAGMALQSGDRVAITGSSVTRNGKTVILATTVRRGDQELRLRDGAGVPAWTNRSRQE
jgi:hypothetical protein